MVRQLSILSKRFAVLGLAASLLIGCIATDDDFAENIAAETKLVTEGKQVIISFDPSGGEGLIADIQAPEKSFVNLPQNTFVKEGKIFEGWSITEYQIVSYIDKGILSTLDQNIVLYAVWRDAIEYSVTFNANTGIGSMEPIKVLEGKSFVIPNNIFTKTEFFFSGWTTTTTTNEQVVYSDGQSIVMPDRNIELIASWSEIPTYSITFNGNAGSGSMDSIALKATENITLPNNTFSRAGYSFAGWSLTSNGIVEYPDQYNLVNINKNYTLFAVWTPLPSYKITFDGNGHTSGSMDEVSYNEGLTATLPQNLFEKTDHVFEGWSTSSAGNINFLDTANVVIGNSDVTLYAVWRNPTATKIWSMQAYIKAPNAQSNDYFGKEVDIDGDRIIVGTYREDSDSSTILNEQNPGNNNNATDAGAVYVFERNSNTWTYKAYLKASNAAEYAYFGDSIGLADDIIAVGSPGEATGGDWGFDVGAAYTYSNSSSGWQETAHIKAANNDDDDYFGTSIAISANTVIIGATGESSYQTNITNGSTASTDNSQPNSGAAYIYVRNGGNWTQEAYLKPSNSGRFDLFGTKVDIDSNTAIVSAPSEDSNQTTISNNGSASSNNDVSSSGAVYVFVRNGSFWTQEAYIKASNAANGDRFGDGGVAISGNTIVVTAIGEDSDLSTVINAATVSENNNLSNSGAAYVFVRNGSSWSQKAYLKASNSGEDDAFGESVDISNNTIIIGARKEDSSSSSISNNNLASSDDTSSSAGAAYVYTLVNDEWVQSAYIKATNSMAEQEFGYSVAISGDTIVIGAPGDASNETSITNGNTASNDTSQINTGAVFVYTLGE